MLSSAQSLLKCGARRGAKGHTARVVGQHSSTMITTATTWCPPAAPSCSTTTTRRRRLTSSCGTFASSSIPRCPPTSTLSCNHHWSSGTGDAPRRLYSSTPSNHDDRPILATAPRSFSSSHYQEEDSAAAEAADWDLELNRASTSRVCSILAQHQQQQQQHDNDHHADGPGAIPPLEAWLEGEKLLHYWVCQRTEESVVASLELLDQLVRTDCHRLKLDIFHAVLNNWRVKWWHTTGLLVEVDPPDRATMPNDKEDQDEAEELRLEEADRLLRSRCRQDPLAVVADRNVDATAIEFDTPRQLFHRIVEYHETYGFQVTEKTFYLILEASISNGNVVDTAAMAQQILDTCLQLFEQTGRQELFPTNLLCNLVLRAWAVSRLPEASQKCEYILERMNALGIPLDSRTYRWLIVSYRNEESVHGALAAERILRRMTSEFEQGCFDVLPCHRTFASVISAWAWSGSLDAGWRGEELMMEMFEKKPDLQWHRALPVFNAVLLCYANLRTHRSARQAYKLLLQHMKSPDKPPDKESYRIVLKALSKVGDAKLTEQLLQRVPDELISTAMYIDLLNALARDQQPHSLDRARNLVDEMRRHGKYNPNLVPDLDTYNALLDCYAKCKGSGHVCTESSEVIEEMMAAGIEPNEITYTCALLVWAKYGHTERALEILALIADPSIQCYNAALSAFIKSKDPQAPYEALQLLRDLGQNGPRPTAYTYTTAISCFANSRFKNKRELARQAESLLREMQRLYQEGDSTVRPTRVTYNAVMNAFARASEPHRAEQILKEMYDDYLTNGNEEARPDASSFNTILKGWTVWYDKTEANGKVLETFARMEELSRTLPEVTPNVITYTTLILSFGLTGQPREADKVFWELDSLHREGKLAKGPSRTTFSTLRRAWISSNDPDKHTRLAQIDQEIEKRFGDHNTDRRRGGRR